MACCGKQREQVGATNPIRPALSAGTSASQRAPVSRQFVVCFEYMGRTGLTVVGPVSGRRYRFDGPGARLVVDPRDQVSLAAVPNLRRTRSF